MRTRRIVILTLPILLAFNDMFPYGEGLFAPYPVQKLEIQLFIALGDLSLSTLAATGHVSLSAACELSLGPPGPEKANLGVVILSDNYSLSLDVATSSRMWAVG